MISGLGMIDGCVAAIVAVGGTAVAVGVEAGLQAERRRPPVNAPKPRVEIRRKSLRDSERDIDTPSLISFLSAIEGCDSAHC
jgi:hypothetical protein